jgi:hypothetical protein
MRFRYVRTQTDDPTVPRSVGPRGTIDLSKPMTLSAYGEYTKKAGYYELSNGHLKELVFEDAAFSAPVKAAKADRYLFRRETFGEYPDLRVSSADFKDSKRISDANPQQKDYIWAAGFSSISRTRMASDFRASSRCPKTISRAKSAR